MRGGHWHLRIKWAKTHQDAADRFWVPLLPRPGLPACPVACWGDLLRLRGDGDRGRPLFWVTWGDTRGITSERPLTMSVARGWLNILLTRLGRGEEGFSFHSFRSLHERVQRGGQRGRPAGPGGLAQRRGTVLLP